VTRPGQSSRIAIATHYHLKQAAPGNGVTRMDVVIPFPAAPPGCPSNRAAPDPPVALLSAPAAGMALGPLRGLATLFASARLKFGRRGPPASPARAAGADDSAAQG
jgi:hypothetical protein